MYKVSVLAINHGMRKFRIPFASVDQVTSLFIFWLFTLFNTRGLKVFRKIFERVVFLEPKYLEKPWESLGKLLILCLKRPPEHGGGYREVFFCVPLSSTSCSSPVPTGFVFRFNSAQSRLSKKKQEEEGIFGHGGGKLSIFFFALSKQTLYDNIMI